MRNLLTLCSLVLFVVGLVPAGAGARTADSRDPVLVGRIAHIEGNLLRYIEEDRDWVRTVRDAPSKFVDTYTGAYRYVNDVPVRNSFFVLDVTDTRANLLSSEKLITGDKYTFIRNAYLQNREFKVKDGQVEDDF